MRQKLTVLVPCKNEEANIGACLESACGIADELLVADSGSRDRTMEIARAFGAHIIERTYVNSADFKNWAIPRATHPWVLVVDADERVTPELAREIDSLLQCEPRHDGYWIYRKSYFLGHHVWSCGWNRDKVLRLFKRETGRYEPKHVHAEVMLPRSRVGRLRGRLEHYAYWTMDLYIEKLGRYTTWGAQDMVERGRGAGVLALTLRPLWRFFRHYILEYGILQGRLGLMVSGLGAASVLVKMSKLWAMRCARPQPAPIQAPGAGKKDAAH